MERERGGSMGLQIWQEQGSRRSQIWWPHCYCKHLHPGPLPHRRTHRAAMRPAHFPARERPHRTGERWRRGGGTAVGFGEEVVSELGNWNGGEG